MSYQEYKPSKELENIIDSYWLVKDLSRFENQRILPDGCTDIIFNLGKSNTSIQKETIVISGMMTKFSDVSLGNNTELLGVRFKTGQLSNLVECPLFEIKDKTIIASDLIPELNVEKLEQLQEKKKIEYKLEFVENVIFKILDTKQTNADILITSVIYFILNSFGTISISQIAENYYISMRQLERKFKAKVGVTLKEYSNIVRFIHTKKSIKTNPNKSLLYIAFDSGYYDHSHLTNEFRRYSGQIPSNFR